MKFKYIAKASPEKVVDGVIEADRLELAVNIITGKGLIPVEVYPLTVKAAHSKKKIKQILSTSFIKTSSNKNVMLFTRQLSDLVGASVPILRALKLIVQQTQDASFKQVVNTISHSVEDGTALSSALTEYPKLFNSFYINMIKTGEQTGHLNVILERLAQHIEQDLKLRRQCMLSLSYPFFVLGIGIVTIIVMFIFVIPRLVTVFEDFNQDLPLPTVIMINLSEFFIYYGWSALILIIGAVWYFKRFIQTKDGKRRMDAFLLRCAYIGTLIKQIEIGRLTRTWGMLVESGVAMSSAMPSVIQTISNQAIKEEISLAAQKVEEGSSLKTSLQPCPSLDSFAVNMIAVGEETGELSRGLYKSADWYERQALDTIQQFISLLGPIVLVLIMMLVGFIAVAILLPIMEMNFNL